MTKSIIKILVAFALVFSLSDCAKMGSPSGGIKDEIPPKVEESKPEANALGFKKDKVRIVFDEIVVLKNLNDYFLVSPPMAKKPKVTAYGKDLTVEFDDALRSNTTYTLYFGDAIVDNNEGNVLPSYTFSFSTGDVVDTMRLQGRVINAHTLDPEAGIIVGIYDNFSDTAFTHDIPLRIAKTDLDGYFSVNNVRPGKYKVRALVDMNNDFMFNQPGETIAFTDSVFETTQETIVLMDSVFLDSVDRDKVHHLVFKELRPRDSVLYYPDDILLMAFVEDFMFQRLSEKQRKQENRLEFTFATKPAETPIIKLQDAPTNSDWYIQEYSSDSTTVMYWIVDTALVKQDTIPIYFEYQKTDTAFQLVWVQDTLDMRFKRKKKSARQLKREAKEEAENPKEIKPLKLELNLSGGLPYFEDLHFISPTPLASVNEAGISLFEQINDSTTLPLTYKLAEAKDKTRTYALSYDWDEEKEYLVVIDLATFIDVYGLANDSIGKRFTIVGEAKFSTIAMSLSNLKGNAVVQLLSKSQEVLESQIVTPELSEAVFYYLKPAKYYVSLFYDTNGNGKWDSGDYEEKRQAEEVHFFPKGIEAKAYYDMEEDWDLKALPITEEKPEDLRSKKKK